MCVIDNRWKTNIRRKINKGYKINFHKKLSIPSRVKNWKIFSKIWKDWDITKSLFVNRLNLNAQSYLKNSVLIRIGNKYQRKINFGTKIKTSKFTILWILKEALRVLVWQQIIRKSFWFIAAKTRCQINLSLLWIS